MYNSEDFTRPESKTKMENDPEIMNVIASEPEEKTSPRESYALNETLYNMQPNMGAELMNYARQKDNIISLAQGEGCTPTPDFIINAATKVLKSGETFYGPPLGLPVLREEVSAYYKRIYGFDISPERVFITTSGSTAMNLALRAILNKDDEVAAVTPIWKNLLGAVELTGAQIRQVPMKEEKDGWTLDLDQLFESCNEKTRALLIVSPSNPTGWCISSHEIRAVLEFARKRNLWVIADEVYSRLTYDAERAESFLDYAEKDDLLLVINSFSKTWAMTGWRLGWITGPEFMSDKIRYLAIYNNLCVSPFIQHAGIAALRDGEDFIKTQLENWRVNRELISRRLNALPGVHVHKPPAAFYAFFRPEREPDCIKFAYRLIDEHGLSLAPGVIFGDCCKGYMRMSFACSKEKTEKALDRLEKALGA